MSSTWQLHQHDLGRGSAPQLLIVDNGCRVNKTCLASLFGMTAVCGTAGYGFDEDREPDWWLEGLAGAPDGSEIVRVRGQPGGDLGT